MIENFIKNLKNNKKLFMFTLAYFILGFINIHFALLGVLCMGIPFILLFRDKKKTWCQHYCPRASLYNKCGKWTNKFSRKTPKFFIKGNMKWIMLSYFFVSISIIIKSTIMVAIGFVPAKESLNFLILFPLPDMIQLFHVTSVPWVIHLAYRFYSMMITTTTLGFILALVYKPRTWCTICPIGTLSDVYVKSQKKSEVRV